MVMIELRRCSLLVQMATVTVMTEKGKINLSPQGFSHNIELENMVVVGIFQNLLKVLDLA